MNVMTLNFLQHTPDENWLDYFINYDKFLDLLRDEKTDQKMIEQLFDQFVDHALFSVSETKNVKRKRMEQEDVEFAEQKADKLWLLGWACAARLGWDLNTLLKCSNVIRVFSMVSRLFEHTFNVKGESDILSYLSRVDDSAFNSKTSFVTWLYARLILIIDMQARAPAPPQKPTVSNPVNQVDPALVEAEKINNFISKVRNHTRNAATFLERLVALNLDQVEIPTFYCFQQTDNQNVNPSASSHQTYVQISGKTFSVRVKFDLFLAHFAASHFGSARKLLNEIAPNFASLEINDNILKSLFAFDSNKFEGYKAALAEPPKRRNKRRKLDINPFEFNTKRVKDAGPNLKVNNELEKAINLFNSAFISKKSQLIPHPTLNSLSIFTDTSPPLWQILHCFDYAKLLTLYDTFCEWDPNERVSNDKAFLNELAKKNCSPIFAMMLEEKPVENEPILFYSMQLERLLDNWSLNHWKGVIESFFPQMVREKWTSHAFAICYEVIRANERIYNSVLGHEKNRKAFEAIANLTQDLVNEGMKTRNSFTEWSLRLIDRIYFVSLLNLGQFEAIIKFPNDFPQVTSQYLIFARIVSTFILHGQQNNTLQWNYFLPLLHRGEFNSDKCLSRENFVDMVRILKNVTVCQYLMSYFVSLYNLGANGGAERQQYPYTKDMQTKNLNILYIDKTIFNTTEVYVLDKLAKDADKANLEYFLTVMEILLRNIILSTHNNPFILCQLADVLYATERYEEAAQLYTTILNEFESGFYEMSDYDKVVTDTMITKLVHCFYEMKLIALAAITGQLLRNVKVHLLYISPILKQTPQASDGGKLYFPYIFNIPIFEAMSDSYERFEMYSYHLQLIKYCPTRASNQGNSADVLREETTRRRSQFIQTLFKTINNRPKKLELFSDRVLAHNV